MLGIQIKPAGKYFITRNGTSIIALAVEKNFVSFSFRNCLFNLFKSIDRGQFKIVAAHTDSPCLRVKPISRKGSREGFSKLVLKLTVEVYGTIGLIVICQLPAKLLSMRAQLTIRALKNIWSMWRRAFFVFRHLQFIWTVVFTKDSNSITKLIWRQFFALNLNALVHLKKFPNLFYPIIVNLWKQFVRNPKAPSQVVSVDLCLYDTQPAVIAGGVNDEFVHSARLDNLFMSHCTLNSL